MTHPRARQAEIDREARRRQIAALVLAGVRDQTRIAEQLGVNQSTISRDIKALEADWKRDAAQDIASAKGLDLDRLDQLIAALWDAALSGKWLATDRIISLMQHRARLLGLEAPQKREDTQRIEIALIVERIAQETGLNKDEILAEAQRIVTAGTLS